MLAGGLDRQTTTTLKAGAMPNSSIPNGTRVVFIRDLDLQPYTTVKAGEIGVIVPSQREDFVDIMLDEDHPGLVQQRNTAWLCLTYDDVREYIEPCAKGDFQWLSSMIKTYAQQRR